MEAVGQLAGGVAHDLNNLLTPILGYSEIMESDLGSDHLHSESVRQIVKAGFRARDVISRLLAFGRKQLLEVKHIDLNTILVNFEKLLRRTIMESIRIELRLATQIPLVKADPGQIEQVIMNLAVNAQDAMPKGGKMIFQTGEIILDQAYADANPDISPGHFTMLAISDNGVGMDDDIRKQIFEPFFTTKEVGKGTGLGLAMVHGIVKQHGGNIWVYSEPGQGSTFKIFLPAIQPSGPNGSAGARTPQSGNDIPRGSETIMVVEDSDAVLALTAKILRQQGYSVLAAADGRRCLQNLDAHKGKLDLLVSDVVMPEMNGKELHAKVAAKHPGVKVVFMSGHTENIIGSHGVIEDGTAFIQKPFSVQAFLDKIRKTLDTPA